MCNIVLGSVLFSVLGSCSCVLFLGLVDVLRCGLKFSSNDLLSQSLTVIIASPSYVQLGPGFARIFSV